MFEQSTYNIIKGLFGIVTTSRNGTQLKGTGFAISDKHIITNKHLCYEDKKFTNPKHIKFQAIGHVNLGKRLTTCNLVYESPTLDLAVFEIIDPTRYCINPLKLYSHMIAIATPVGTIGYPFDFKNQAGAFLFNARFRSLHLSTIFKDAYELDQEMYPGSSGSPVYLSNGAVVGIHYSTKVYYKTTVNVSFTIPSNNIISELVNAGIPHTTI